MIRILRKKNTGKKPSDVNESKNGSLRLPQISAQPRLTEATLSSGIHSTSELVKSYPSSPRDVNQMQISPRGSSLKSSNHPISEGMVLHGKPRALPSIAPEKNDPGKLEVSAVASAANRFKDVSSRSICSRYSLSLANLTNRNYRLPSIAPSLPAGRNYSPPVPEYIPFPTQSSVLPSIKDNTVDKEEVEDEVEEVEEEEVEEEEVEEEVEEEEQEDLEIEECEDESLPEQESDSCQEDTESTESEEEEEYEYIVKKTSFSRAVMKVKKSELEGKENGITELMPEYAAKPPTRVRPRSSFIRGKSSYGVSNRHRCSLPPSLSTIQESDMDNHPPARPVKRVTFNTVVKEKEISDDEEEISEEEEEISEEEEVEEEEEEVSEEEEIPEEVEEELESNIDVHNSSDINDDERDDTSGKEMGAEINRNKVNIASNKEEEDSENEIKEELSVESECEDDTLTEGEKEVEESILTEEDDDDYTGIIKEEAEKVFDNEKVFLKKANEVDTSCKGKASNDDNQQKNGTEAEESIHVKIDKNIAANIEAFMNIPIIIVTSADPEMDDISDMDLEISDILTDITDSSQTDKQSSSLEACSPEEGDEASSAKASSAEAPEYKEEKATAEYEASKAKPGDQPSSPSEDEDSNAEEEDEANINEAGEYTQVSSVEAEDKASSTEAKDEAKAGDKASNAEAGDKASSTKAKDEAGNAEAGDKASSTKAKDEAGNAEAGDKASNTQAGDKASNAEAKFEAGNAEARDKASNAEVAGDKASNTEAGDKASNAEAGVKASNPEAGDNLASNAEARSEASNAEVAGDKASNAEAGDKASVNAVAENEANDAKGEEASTAEAGDNANANNNENISNDADCNVNEMKADNKEEDDEDSYSEDELAMENNEEEEIIQDVIEVEAFTEKKDENNEDKAEGAGKAEGRRRKISLKPIRRLFSKMKKRMRRLVKRA